MAERKSGPVKPPVIDLTARPADPKPADAPRPEVATPEAAKLEAAGKPEAPGKPGPRPETKAAKPGPVKPAAPEPKATPAAEPAAAAAEKAPPKPVAVPARQPAPWGAALAAGLGGAVLAVAVCYGLAHFGFWPADAAGEARLAALEGQLAQSQSASAAATTSLADVNTRLGGLETDFAARLAAASSTLGTLQDSVKTLQAADRPADLGPVQAQLRTLSARVDAVAAGASSADAGAIAANLATVQQDVAGLSQKIAALGDRAGATDTAMQSLKAELDSAKGAIDKAAAAPSPKTIASAMQLPLLISALEADFAAGRPYDADLRNLVAAVPETHVPAGVGDAAATGLPAPGELVAAFEAKMPELIAARPAAAGAGWQGQLGDWVTNVLALRQQGEKPGDGPDAVLSRLEAAVNRHDFTGAATLLGQLPAPMQQAAGDVGGRIRAVAEAQNFTAGLRQTALAPAAGAAQ